MWIKQIFMAMVGFSCGLGVAGGLFALIIALGLVAEFADQTHTAKHICGSMGYGAYGDCEYCSYFYTPY